MRRDISVSVRARDGSPSEEQRWSSDWALSELQQMLLASLIPISDVQSRRPLKLHWRCMTESVAVEIDPAWNIKITLIEPGSFNTELIRKTTFSDPHPAYAKPYLPFTRLRESWATRVGRGDSWKAAQAFYKLADLPNPPLHFIVGVDANEMARKKLAELQASLDTYESWSVGLDRDT